MFPKRLIGCVAAAAVAAGCSSSGASPAGSVRAAVRATLAAGSVQEQVQAVTPTASGQSTTTATGAYSFTRHQGTFDADTGIIGKIHALIDGSTLYFQLPPAVADQLPVKKPWVSVDLAHPPAFPGIGNLGNLAGGADPSRSLQPLENGLTNVTKVGTEKVGADQTTHYRATLDLNKAKAGATPDQQKALQAQIDLVGTPTSTIDMFVGPGGRLRREISTVDLSASKVPGAAAAKGSATVTADLTGYGTPVDITVPPPSDVIGAAQLLGQ